MLLRALLLLLFFIGLSVAATLHLGQEVLIAAGLILTQAKLLLKKLAGIELPVFVLWLKTYAADFFRVELIKKWLTTSVMPLVLGKALLRRVQQVVEGYMGIVRDSHARLMAWFRALSPLERALAWGIILFATLALSITTVGLWLILFSVQLPLWLAAAVAAAARMTWASVQKMVFKALAFLQLKWLWRALRRVLPAPLLGWLRRVEFRIVRRIVRRRRMTLKQLVDRKGRLPFKLGLLAEYLFHPPGRR